MVADSIVPYISAILVGIAAILSAFLTAAATRAARVAKAAEVEVTAVDVSLKSLREALIRADTENKSLRETEVDIRKQMKDMIEAAEKARIACEAEIAGLNRRIHALERQVGK